MEPQYRMNHIFQIILILACALCAHAEAPPPLRIVTSFYPVYITTLNIAGDVQGVALTNMAPPFAGCLHDYQFTPNDLKVLSQADVFVINGLGSEPFLNKVVRQRPALKVIDASRRLIAIKDEGGRINPHVWVSISNVIVQCRTIADELAAHDPPHADRYDTNADRYIERLAALQAELAAGARGFAKRDIVTFHEAFAYFAREYDLQVRAVIEREPGAEPNAREMADIIRLIRKTGITTIFVEPQYPSHCAEVIARETKAAILTLDPAVTGPARGDAYLDIMRANGAVLQRALK